MHVRWIGNIYCICDILYIVSVIYCICDVLYLVYV